MTQKILINLYGGAGSGKSTGAAYIFSQLKLRGVLTEIHREPVKDAAYKGSVIRDWSNPLLILGDILDKQKLYLQHVDVVVSDAPLLQALFYIDNSKKKVPLYLYLKRSEPLNNILQLHYIIERDKPYIQIGRVHSEQDSNKYTFKIKQELEKYLFSNLNMPIKIVKGNEIGYNKIIEDICHILQKNAALL